MAHRSPIYPKKNALSAKKNSHGEKMGESLERVIYCSERCRRKKISGYQLL